MYRILIVDDEKSIRLTLREFLIKEGYSTDIASDVQEAKEHLKRCTFDVVITDIVMPQGNGIELIEEIRQNSETMQLIIMTGEPTVDTAIRAVRSGANDYLTKPIKKDTLIKAVRQATAMKTLMDEKRRLENENLLYQKSLEEIVRNKTKALQNSMSGIISLLSDVVEARDPYTAGHQVRVGNLSADIARKMMLPRKTVDIVQVIGYIHDIGKIGVPIEILSKPGKLTPLEIQIIREHPTNGYKMLKKAELPEIIADTIYSHHERCDGSGYPQGLKQNDINMEAQIIMVADVVEAMISHRPYRPALGIDAALSEIMQHAGTAYNPDIVNACFSLIYKDNYSIDNVQHEIVFPM